MDHEGREYISSRGASQAGSEQPFAPEEEVQVGGTIQCSFIQYSVLILNKEILARINVESRVYTAVS